ncbi:MAG: FKBP-type peptidyl-prolyl cis-trans isomerase [Jatrophihabitans sp.]
MATNKQRREAERLRLQRQLQARRQREQSRQRFTLIASIVGTLAVIAVVIILIVTLSGGSSGNGKKDNLAKGASPSPTATGSSAAACGSEQFPTKAVRPAKGAAVTFEGVTVKGAKDLGGKPGVTAKGSSVPTKLAYTDLVVGTGAAAGPTSCVSVQYDGVLYKEGTEFDSSWKRGSLTQFPLTGVVPGFTQGIGGTTGVPPMKVGGRRIMILPPALGYGAAGQPPTIPPNAALVFVVDLVKVT